ncbi:MAG: NUDIX hydrolase [Bacteroidota bacterium]
MLKVEKVYGNKVRVRVCGICVQDNKLLLANHPALSKAGNLWIPPGGRTEYGSNLKENLIREFKEETNLDIEVKEFMFVNEFINPPLHAIEIFYKVKIKSGKLQTGKDPELSEKDQLITEVKFMDFDEINTLSELEKHSVLNEYHSLNDLLSLKGYFIFENK